MKKIRTTSQAGFTLIELIVVVVIVLILFSLSVINLSTAQQKNDLSSTVDTLISDLKQQQLKAMIGDTDNRSGATSGSSYGVHINTNSYVLFYGTGPHADNTDYTVSVPSPFSLSSTFPSAGNRNVIFSQITGEVSGYTAGSDTITVTDSTSGATQTIHINRYGVVTQVN